MNELEKKYSDFITTLSHELRTPLTSIKGFADTLITSGDKLSEEQKSKFLVIIKEQAERLIKMVEDVLSVSKLDSQDSLFVFKPMNILPVVEQTVQIVKSKYSEHIFKIEAPKYIPDIYADADKFQQVMVNLVENAAKYSSSGTTVVIKISIKEQDLSVEVIDQGIGIDAQNFDKIFEKFSRLDTPLTRKTEGSGIGLYITKSLVEKMNGKISVSSTGNGSVFEIRMPLSSPECPIINKMKDNKNVD